jgi:hypothetical protein
MLPLLAATCLSVFALQPPAAPPAPQHELVNADRVMAFLKALPTKRSATGDAAHLEGLRETERLIERELTAIGYEPMLWGFTWGKGTHPLDDDAAEGDKADPAAAHRWNNIIAEVKGAAHPEEIVIIGAHFDAVPDSPGADDNGTGTAATMELARIFRDAAPKRTLRFVFFNVEEPGLVGSRKYAAAAKRAMERAPEDGKPQRRVVAMLSLEMLGYYCDKPGCQRSPIPAIPGVWEPPATGDFLAIATTVSHNWLGELIEREWKEAQPDFKLIRPSFIPDIPNTPPDLLRSDHAPFLFIGVPAAIIADTANFRSPHYHQPTDTIETIDEARFVSAVRGLAGVVRELGWGDLPKLPKPAQQPKPPEAPLGTPPAPR